MRLLGLAQPTVSTHLRLLREAGLVQQARGGRRTSYSLDRDRFEELLGKTAAAIPDS